MKLLGLLLIMILPYIFINCDHIENLQASYNPELLLSNIFGTKLTLLSKTKDKMQFNEEIKLEDINTSRKYDIVFGQERPFTFEDNEQSFEHGTPEYQDQNKKKRRRRRRKPKNQISPGNLAYQGPSQGSFGLNPYGHSGFSLPHQPFYQPPPFEKPSVASEALLAISDALTSIALYDDQQCVPRLLCEAAGGGKLGSTSLLQPIAGLQPLLTLLSAYNGISTSPLFVFGHAVFLGITSKGNPGTCRYAYPQCPTDPEQLVHYLNNHNGGFFRFFSAPKGQQNRDQFYNQLSGSYGLYQPNLNLNQNTYNDQSNGYGFYQPNQLTNDGFHLQNLGYGLYKPNDINNQQTYSSTYNHDKFKFEEDNDIEKRILNSPSNNFLGDDIDDEYADTKLSFPDNTDFYKPGNNIKDARKFKFPDETSNVVGSSNQNNYNDYYNHDYKRKPKSILFPDSDKTRYTNKQKYINTYMTQVNVKDYIFDHEHNFYVKNVNDDDGLRTVYVVRGNGDPNHPEIIKVKPGESIK